MNPRPDASPRSTQGYRSASDRVHRSWCSTPTPRLSLAREHLSACAQADWIPEIEAMIVDHHKITPSRPNRASLVEPFRRADWIDVSRGLRTFGVPRSFIASVFTAWPSAGFHWRLVQLALERFRTHPLTPLPMVKL